MIKSAGWPSVAPLRSDGLSNVLFQKHEAQIVNPIAKFRLIQIPASYLVSSYKCAFAGNVDRTKKLRVKHFGKMARNPRRLHRRY
jgi:hypothetical protein